jgi:hypothetical protein
MKGAGFISAAKSVINKARALHEHVKKGRFISRGLQYVGDVSGNETAKRYAAAAHQRGYGQKGGCKCAGGQGGGGKRGSPSSKMIF